MKTQRKSSPSPRKPVKLWAYQNSYVYMRPQRQGSYDQPVLVIPLDPASCEALVEEAGMALWRFFDADEVRGDHPPAAYHNAAKAILERIGLRAGKVGSKE